MLYSNTRTTPRSEHNWLVSAATAVWSIPHPFRILRPHMSIPVVMTSRICRWPDGVKRFTPAVRHIHVKTLLFMLAATLKSIQLECYLPRLSGANKVSLFRADSLARYLLQCAQDSSVVAMDKTVVGLNVATRSCNVYLLTPWSRVLLEKLTSKLCS